MVPTLTLIYMLITLILTLVVPVVILLLLMRRRKGVFSAWAAGALGFFLPQAIIRIPILQALGQTAGFQDFSRSSPYVLAALLALSAALFETAGRFIVLKVGLGKRLSYMTGVAAGAGHGAIESMYLIGLTYINNIVISFMINAGSLDSLFPGDPDQAEAIRQAILGTEQSLFLAAGFERIFTMAFHAAMSVLLAWLIMKGRPLAGFLLVFLLHTVLDGAVAAMQVAGVAVWRIEAAIAAAAVLSVLFIVRVRRLFGQDQDIPADPAEQAVKEGY